MVDNQHWLDRWNENRIGFHEDSVNRHLQSWFPELAPEPGAGVFLPLCGKALDMHWIAQQGYQVLGVELSRLAVESFFEEAGLAFERSERDGFNIYQSENIRLLQGDFFDLRAHHLEGCRLAYDRAALIAMEQPDRPRYYEHMRSILPPGCNMLLVSLHYDQTEMRGPPFSVPTDEILQNYDTVFDIDVLDSQDILDEGPRWRKVGLTALQETVFRLRR